MGPDVLCNALNILQIRL